MQYGIANLVEALSSPGGKESSDARGLAQRGIRGDDRIAHVQTGELMIPPQYQTPGIMSLVSKEIREQGGQPSAYIAGSKHAERNPHTGVQMAAPAVSLGDVANNPHPYGLNTPFEDLPDYMQPIDPWLAAQPKWYTDAYEYDYDPNQGWEDDDIEDTWRDQKPFFNLDTRALNPIDNSAASLADLLAKRYGTGEGDGYSVLGSGETSLLGLPDPPKKRDELLEDVVEDVAKKSGVYNLQDFMNIRDQMKYNESQFSGWSPSISTNPLDYLEYAGDGTFSFTDKVTDLMGGKGKKMGTSQGKDQFWDDEMSDEQAMKYFMTKIGAYSRGPVGGSGQDGGDAGTDGGGGGGGSSGGGGGGGQNV
jgi:uncharacterized membrane protein YgcG